MSASFSSARTNCVCNKTYPTVKIPRRASGDSLLRIAGNDPYHWRIVPMTSINVKTAAATTLQRRHLAKRLLAPSRLHAPHLQHSLLKGFKSLLFLGTQPLKVGFHPRHVLLECARLQCRLVDTVVMIRPPKREDAVDPTAEVHREVERDAAPVRPAYDGERGDGKMVHQRDHVERHLVVGDGDGGIIGRAALGAGVDCDEAEGCLPSEVGDLVAEVSVRRLWLEHVPSLREAVVRLGCERLFQCWYGAVREVRGRET